MGGVLLRLLILALVLAGCTQPGSVPGPAPVYIYDARPLIPEPWFELVWEQVKRCTGSEQGYADIRWFVTPPGVMGEQGLVPDGSSAIAGTWSRPNHIFLDARFTVSEWVLVHELVHYALQNGGPEVHADSTFMRCSGSAP